MTSQPKDLVADAAEACARLCRRLGMHGVAPVILHVSQHIGVRLHPFDVVARIVDAADREALVRIARELDVARHLVTRAAPIVPPGADWPAGPHVQDGFAVTLWSFVRHVAADEDDGEHVARAAHSLLHVHQALLSYRGALPYLWTRLDRCRRLLELKSALPALRAADRIFLRETFDRLRASISRLPVRIEPIHGDAHLGNVLITADGALWNDLEDVCLGPREWDIGWLPQADLARLEAVDLDVLSAMAYLRSLCVSVWCWEKSDSPEKREAAECHLAYLKTSCPF